VSDAALHTAAHREDWRDRLRRLRAPRRLKATFEGRWLLIITLVVGFAAMNTGNNLLFFGWGLLLASVIISGLLSEATLRVIRCRVLGTGELRAGESGAIRLELSNVGERLPAFGIEVTAHLEDESGALREAPARYHLRLSPQRQEPIAAHDRPRRRGVHRLTRVQVGTRYPFGFFVKSRDFDQHPPIDVVVYPRRVDVGGLGNRLLARLGSQPTRKVGPGDEYFSLRPFREGDDLRRVHWRRSARSERLQVKETESEASRQVIVEVVLAAGAPLGAVEEALAFGGSLAEDLLQHGHAVGLRAPGVALPPGRGSRQRAALLTALARLDPAAPLPPTPGGPSVARVAVLTPGAAVPIGISFSHVVDEPPSLADEAPSGKRAKRRDGGKR
jgi:uncharacterized protein (DUF58 family)